MWTHSRLLLPCTGIGQQEVYEWAKILFLSTQDEWKLSHTSVLDLNMCLTGFLFKWRHCSCAFLLWPHLMLAQWHMKHRNIQTRRIRETIDTSLSSWQAACPAVRIRQERGNQQLGTRKWNCHTPLRAQWRMTNLVSSDRTRSVSYTALSASVGGKIKATLIHNRGALLSPAGGLIKIERAVLHRGRTRLWKTRKRVKTLGNIWQITNSKESVIALK